MRKQLLHFIKGFKEILSSRYSKYHDELPYFITSFIALLIVLVGIYAFIELTQDLSTTVMAGYDKSIAAFAVSLRTPQLTQIMQYITNIGDLYGYLVMLVLCTIAFYIAFKNWRYVLQIVFVLMLSSLANTILKKIINRARPTATHLVTVKTLSYPSGHAMSAMAFYGFMIYLLFTFKMNKYVKTALISVCGLMIVAIGFSRIYLGVHFPSDIAGGYIAGFIWVVFCALLFNLIYFFRREKADKKRKKEGINEALDSPK